ncbi:MAG: PorP/SprF family type IX secretion system membrane protein [Saprospirales bacterium]|jgi:type IX secretion system PorP/SprF family membrane protein|nr:PorP/SprF family type IX secretion system membrane protein [Saprospirales bacterium]MBK6904607.1 PorP/SprF family type IX secretion system membrane protein [Saprospirales bacterium]MBK7336239.1 PorP/SprF family type IX secretion system membrane protein [Saprospirales bacterium]
MNRFLTLLLFFCSASALFAQDPQFSQFYGSPLTLNPALTGAFDGSYRVGIIYRDQWRKVLESPYQTYSAAVDLRFGIDQRRGKARDYAAIGLLFFADKVGGLDFSTNQISLNGAFHKSLNPRNSQYISIGIQGAISQRNLGYEDLYFSDQFNGVNSYGDPTGEDLPANNFAFADFSAGLNYSYAPKQKVGLFLGLAMHHFLSPSVSFYDPEIDETPENKLFSKYSAQFSLQLPLGERVQFIPRALAAIQGPHFVANGGASFRFQLSSSGGLALHLGSWLRPVWNEDNAFGLDAVVGMLGIEYSNVLFGVSYDAYLTDLTNARQGQGALEISIAYLGNYNNDSVLCPKF